MFSGKKWLFFILIFQWKHVVGNFAYFMFYILHWCISIELRRWGTICKSKYIVLSIQDLGKWHFCFLWLFYALHKSQQNKYTSVRSVPRHFTKKIDSWADQTNFEKHRQPKGTRDQETQGLSSFAKVIAFKSPRKLVSFKISTKIQPKNLD